MSALPKFNYTHFAIIIIRYCCILYCMRPIKKSFCNKLIAGWSMSRERELLDSERIIIIVCSINISLALADVAEFFDTSKAMACFCASRNRDLPTSFGWYTMYHIIRESDRWWSPSLSNSTALTPSAFFKPEAHSSTLKTSGFLGLWEDKDLRDL